MKEEAAKKNKNNLETGEEGKTEDKEEKTEEKSDKQAPNSGNGGQTDKYSWGQTLDEVFVYLPLPDNVRAKDLDVQIKALTLKVGVKGQTPIVDGEFFKKVKAGDCMWNVESDGNKRLLNLTLTKVEGQNWWHTVIKGDIEIDTQKVEPENSKLSDLDGETRKTVEKMMYDQQAKQMGKPTSDEVEKREKLKAFMDAHPEMDFSKAKFS